MADCDVGEMFLNFMLDPLIRSRAGVDLSIFDELDKNGKESLKGCWERMLMGFSPSPYIVTKGMLVMEREIRGGRLDEKNVFRWNKVVEGGEVIPHYF